MSIERTFTVYRKDADFMLMIKGVFITEDDSNERVADLLYKNRECVTENYEVINDDQCWDETDYHKYSW